VKPYGLTTGWKGSAYHVTEHGAKTRIAGGDHGRRHRWRQLQAKGERARVRAALKEQDP